MNIRVRKTEEEILAELREWEKAQETFPGPVQPVSKDTKPAPPVLPESDFAWRQKERAAKRREYMSGGS